MWKHNDEIDTKNGENIKMKWILKNEKNPLKFLDVKD